MANRSLKQWHKWVIGFLVASALFAAGYAYQSTNYSFVYFGPLPLNTPFKKTFEVKTKGQYRFSVRSYFESNRTNDHDWPVLNSFEMRAIDNSSATLIKSPATNRLETYEVTLDRPTSFEVSVSVKDYDHQLLMGEEKTASVSEVYLFVDRLHR